MPAINAFFQNRSRLLSYLLVWLAAGCSGPPGAQLEDERRAAYAAMREALAAFDSRDYPAAEQKLTTALDFGVLNPDVYCEATAKRAVCWGATGKHDEALAELDKLGLGAQNQDEIHAARSYVLAKQGKAAESRAALAKARQLNRSVQEFKD